MTLPFLLEDQEANSLLIEIDRRITNLEGKIGKGLSHSDLKDIEDHKTFLKQDGSVPVTGSLDFSKSGQIKNTKNRVLNIDIFKGSVKVNESKNQLDVDSAVITAGTDHGLLSGLGGDDHSQYYGPGLREPDHVDLPNIGTNTHAQIDTHIADSSDPHGSTLTQTTLNVAGFVVFGKAAGKGLKVDTVSPTFGFADLLGEVIAKNTGASKPSFVTYRDNLLEFQFSAGEEEYFKFHIPHDYVKGSDIFVHVHWSHTGTLVTGGSLIFNVESSYSKSHNQAPFPASVNGDFTGAASTVQYQQILSEVQLSASSPTGLQIDTDDLEPDGVIILTLQMKTNNITVSGGGVPSPFIHYVDIHYQTTGLIGTKDKAPDFYA